MFTDGRSRRVAFVAHCFLNQNAISDGTAVWPAACLELVDFFLSREIGIVQMPCPEVCCLGLDRGNPQGADSPVVVENTRIRAAMKADGPDSKLSALALGVAEQIEEYQKFGFEVVGIVGANRSPNCGVDTTSDDNREQKGMGIFMEKISGELSKRGITVPMAGIRASDDIAEVLDTFL